MVYAQRFHLHQRSSVHRPSPLDDRESSYQHRPDSRQGDRSEERSSFRSDPERTTRTRSNCPTSTRKRGDTDLTYNCGREKDVYIEVRLFRQKNYDSLSGGSPMTQYRRVVDRRQRRRGKRCGLDEPWCPSRKGRDVLL